MIKEHAKKFLDAIKAANIGTYEFDSDLGTHFYNNDNAIIKADTDNGYMINIRSTNYGGSHHTFEAHTQVVLASFDDIHEARVAGDSDQIKTLVENLGFSLSEDDLKIIVNIDKGNMDIIPITGDYVSGFHYLSAKQYNELTPEEQADYDARKKAYEDAKANYIGKNQAAQITL